MQRENLVEVKDTLQERVVGVIMQVKNSLGENKITADTIHVIIKQVMELVDKFSIPGKEKRVYVVTIVKELVDDLAEDETEIKLINDMIEKRVLENTIDLIISASKGDFDINNKNTQEKIVKYVRTVVPLIIQFFLYLYNSCKNLNKKKKTDTDSNDVVIEEIKEPASASASAPASEPASAPASAPASEPAPAPAPA